MKNAYAAKLQTKKADELAVATQQGFTFAMCLVSVALNNLYGFGKGRLDALEAECQRILDGDFKSDPDMELAAYSLAERVEKIRAKGGEKTA